MRPMFSILMENPWFLHGVHVFSMEFHDFSMGNPWYISVRVNLRYCEPVNPAWVEQWEPALWWLWCRRSRSKLRPSQSGTENALLARHKRDTLSACDQRHSMTLTSSDADRLYSCPAGSGSSWSRSFNVPPASQLVFPDCGDAADPRWSGDAVFDCWNNAMPPDTQPSLLHVRSKLDNTLSSTLPQHPHSQVYTISFDIVVLHVGPTETAPLRCSHYANSNPGCPETLQIFRNKSYREYSCILYSCNELLYLSQSEKQQSRI